MGLPVERLIIATNENDILARTLATGRYEPRGVKATQSPSMDIEVSSNFERLLFEASGQDPEAVRADGAISRPTAGSRFPRPRSSASAPISAPSGSTRRNAPRR